MTSLTECVRRQKCVKSLTTNNFYKLSYLAIRGFKMTTVINKEKYLELKDSQEEAEMNDFPTFNFEGREFKTPITKYLVDFLKGLYEQKNQE